MNSEQKYKIKNLLKKRWKIMNGFFVIFLIIFGIIDIIHPVLPLSFFFFIWSIANIVNLFFSIFKYKAFAYAACSLIAAEDWCGVSFLQKDSKSFTPRSDLFFAIISLIAELSIYIVIFWIGVDFLNLHF